MHTSSNTTYRNEGLEGRTIAVTKPRCQARTVHLATRHRLDDVRIYQKECKSLATAGYEVHFLTTTGSTEDLPQLQAEASKVGVHLQLVPRPQSRWQRLTRMMLALYRQARALDAGVYHFHDLELIPLGWLLKLRGRRVIYDVHEDNVHDVLSWPELPPSLRPIISKMLVIIEAINARVFDGVIAATPNIAKRFPPRKTALVQNYPILDELVVPDPQPYQERPPHLIYVGGITAPRCIREMVRAMHLLLEAFPARLTLAGSFIPANLEEEIRQMPGWEHVDFVGWRSRADLGRLLAQSRAGLVLFHPEPSHVVAQPNKIFEYMAASLPVIASDFPGWRSIIEGSNCGLLVDPQDPQAIAEAIRWLLEHPVEAEAMGRRGRDAVCSRYNWHAETEKLKAIYQKVESRK